MYDVSSPASLTSLKKWWNEFRERAPVGEDEEAFCVAVVGNKIDFPVASGSGHGRVGKPKPKNGNALANGDVNGNEMDVKGIWKVSESDAEVFLEELIPSSVVPTSDTNNITEESGADAELSLSIPSQPPSDAEDDQPLPLPPPEPNCSPPHSPPTRTRSTSITITNRTHPRTPSPSHLRFSSRGQSRSRSRQGYSTRGSLSTMATRESIYHTPSSSFFDVYESARSSPVPFPSNGDGQRDGYESMKRPRVRSSVSTVSNSTTTGSLSSLSGQTITQSLFRRSGPRVSPPTPEPEAPSSPILPPRDRRPKLFFTSAKTGEGVKDVFEYVARRVVVGWEWDARAREDWVDVWHEEETIRLGLGRERGRGQGQKEGWGMKIGRSCCA